MPDATIEVELLAKDKVAILRLNRPEQGNAISLGLAQRLSELVNKVSNDRAVRCVLLTGTGRFFCVGGDIGSFASAGDGISALLGEITHHLNLAVCELAQMDKPLLVAVNGPAAGAGLGLAMLGDIVLAARSSHFTMAYTAIGLTPDGGTSILLPRLVGLRRAQDLALTNRRVSSEEALSIGLVTHLIDDELLEEQALAQASRLAAGPTRAFGAVRRLLTASYTTSFESQLHLEAETICDAAASGDGKEGIGAFLSKRVPVFQG